jgi:hypothetical protein
MTDAPDFTLTPSPADPQPAMQVEVRPYQPGICSGNILWNGRWPMRGGKFPAGHPVGNGNGLASMEFGYSEAMGEFRSRGYWASCFPEGDGITFKPLHSQSNKRTRDDVRECFGWEVKP